VCHEHHTQAALSQENYLEAFWWQMQNSGSGEMSATAGNRTLVILRIAQQQQ